MTYKKFLKLLFFGALLISLNNSLPSECWGYATTLQEMSQQDATQLLRVSLEPAENRDTVNVYLYTSDKYPVIKEKNNSTSAHIIELYDTGISTTNNINTQRVSSLVSNVKIVPYINTSNPGSVNMTRVIIKPKVPGVKYNVFVKTLKTSGQAKNKISAKVYYPPKLNNNLPQSMAIFSPLDDDLLAQLPPEKASNPGSVPTAPPIDTTNNAPVVPTDSKLKVNPPQTLSAPVAPQNVQNLPEISGTPVGTQTVPPNLSPSVPPSNAATTALEEPTQGVEAPQPPPKNTQETIKTSLSQPVALALMVLSGLFLLIAMFVVFMIFKKLRDKKKQKAINLAVEQENTSIPAGFEELDTSTVSVGSSSGTDYSIKTTTINGTLIDEVEEVVVLDGFVISETKSVFLVKFMDSISLVSSVDNEVTVLYNFASYEVSDKNLEIKITEKYKVTGKEMIEISIGDWKAVLASENNHVSLNNVISS